jgi:glycosyltransferase involved in cell wall biosynthesis
VIIDVVIPAFNEAGNIGKVVQAIPRDWVRSIVVADNNSTDETAQVAAQAGAVVVVQPLRGYGNACLKALMRVAENHPLPDVVVFIDGDFSDYPAELPLLIAPILRGDDLVIGSRLLGKREKGAMTIPQIFGNWLSTNLLRLLYGVHFTDLGPFRAIRYDALMRMKMEDKNFGWTVEMQAKAAKMGLQCSEVAVNYRRRFQGKSKVSGTIKGTFLAGYKILYTIYKLQFWNAK